MTASQKSNQTPCQQQAVERKDSMCKRVVSLALLLTCILVWAVPKAIADTCPPGASATGVGLVLTALRTNTTGGGFTAIIGNVGACETIYLQASLSYVPFDANGFTVAAFQNGSIGIFRIDTSFTNNATPPGGIPKIGPASAIGNPGVCNPVVATNIIGSQVIPY